MHKNILKGFQIFPVSLGSARPSPLAVYWTEAQGTFLLIIHKEQTYW